MTMMQWTTHREPPFNLRDEGDYQARFGRSGLLVHGHVGEFCAVNSWFPVSIWYCVKGSLQLQCRDQTIGLQAGEAFVAECGTRMSILSTGRVEAQVVAVILPCAQVTKLAELETGRRLSQPVVLTEKLADDSGLTWAMQKLHADLERHAMGPLDEAQWLRQTLVPILNHQRRYDDMIARCPGRGFGYQRQLFQRLLRAHQYIEWHGGNDAALVRLGTIANLSPTHFQRLFKTAFGYSPHALATRVRMSLARDLLTASARGVAEICRDLGFENRCAFARLFRQYFGISPTEMRRRNLSAIVNPQADGSVALHHSEQLAMA